MPQVHATSWFNPVNVIASGWAHRMLIYRLARREIEARYRGSLLGLAWSVLVPLAMLGVYTFVFSVIWESRWGVEVSGKGHFALVLFIGMILFNLFAECVNRAPSLMLGNVEYIKRVVFPLEALTWVTVAVATFNALVSGCVLLVGYAVLCGCPPVTVVALPVAAVPLILVSIGLTWFLASVGVYFRDVGQFMPVLTTILMFLHPVFYGTETLPPRVRPLLSFAWSCSPLAVAIDEARAALFYKRWPTWWLLGVHILLGFVIAWLGCAWFMKTRKGFADVV